MGIVNKAAALSRRSFARILAGTAFPAAWSAPEFGGPDTLAGLQLERRYRADAQVLLFGLPLLRRQDVGAGSVVWRESGGSPTARLLEFNGFSRPERAAGLNRMGFIREMFPGAGNDNPESAYFGLMTSSPEESAEDARKALHARAREQDYTAIEGRIGTSENRTSIARFTAPATLSGDNRAELVERAHRALASAREVRTAGPARETPHSFLQELAGLLMRPDGQEGRYIYSGRIYRMRLARSVDGKATAYFRERRLLAPDAQAVRVAGGVRREAGGKLTEFRLWIASGGERPLPLRIEYQAKSYLRLVFEAAAK